MFKMYGFWRSAAAFRVRCAMHLKGLAYEEVMIDLDAGEQDAPAFRALNPSGAVPVLFVDDGPSLTQSIAILEYLEEMHPTPRLLPEDPRDRARVRAIALLFAADHHPLIVPRIRRYLADEFGLDHACRTDWITHWFREGLVQAEARLKDDPATGVFCHGDKPSIADLCFISLVMGARGFDVRIADLPTVDRIAKACLDLDEIARAVPLRQSGAPDSH